MKSAKSEKKLFLLDAYALIFRAYYAFAKNPRFNSAGLNTSAILGFVNTLDDLLKKENPTHIGVVFDPPPPNFRHKLYSEYKANRSATPDEIIKSVPYIKKIIEAFHIPVIEISGYEADDTIGTLSKKAEKDGFQVFMMTPDKDFGQLVSENIFIYKPKRSDSEVEILGTKEICEKYQISNPKQVIDILAIWGDTSDNVPGIPGIGELTSIKLISKYGSLENIYENLSDFKGKQKENITNNRQTAELAKILVTIKLDVPCDFKENEYLRQNPNYEALKKIFEELEFRALEKRLIPENIQNIVQGELFEMNTVHTVEKHNSFKDTEHFYYSVTDKESRNELLKTLLNQKEVSFGIRATGSDAHSSEITSLTFSFKEHIAYFVPLGENISEILNEFKSFFNTTEILKIGLNIKFDIEILKNNAIEFKGPIFDIGIAHYLLHPELPHNLTQISESYLKYTPTEIEQYSENEKRLSTLYEQEDSKISNYSAEIADVIFQLKQILQPELEKEDLLNLAESIEFPLVFVLSDMEYTGISIDTNLLSVFEKELTVKIESIENEIFKISGYTFNISSPKQLGELLFEKMKIINDPKLTKTKQYATGEQELIKIKDKHIIIELILDFRGLSKLLNTYVKSLPLIVNRNTNRIHTNYMQTVTNTGRLSCVNPNLQNIPIKSTEGKRIRSAFISSSPDKLLVSADYSQIELRVMAHLSCDLGMIEAFRNNEDIHSATASKIYNTQEVTPEMRSKAKSANFGIIYGISSFGLSENLKISKSEAKELIDGYFKSYPQVKTYMDKMIKLSRINGYVSTLFGRKRYIPEINSHNSMVRSAAERIAINTPVQGTAADIVKICMLNCYQKIKSDFPEAKLILQVHDELVFEIPSEINAKFTESIQHEMENAVKLNVPLLVAINSGKNWLSAH